MDEDERLKLNSFIELNFQLDKKVKISPIGEVVGVDGRVFIIDGNKVLEATKKIGIDIALNENHWGSKAFGWFALNSLELRDDGIYASLELNDLGKPAIENKHYRYLSPEYLVDNNRNVLSIVGVGLVNQPNLLNKALNKKEKKGDNKMDKDEQIKQLTTQIEEANKTIENLTTQLKATKINNAIASGVMLPAHKDFAMSLEPNQIDSYLATLNTKPQIDALKQELKTQTKQNNTNTAEAKVFAQLGIGE